MEQQFQHIFEQEDFDALLPFLKGLSADQRTQLGKIASKMADERQGCSQYSDTSNNKYTILSVVLFVCLDYAKYKRHCISLSYMGDGFVAFNKFHQKDVMARLSTDDLLEWHVPDWFEKFLSNPRDNEAFKKASYLDIMRWYDKGYIHNLSPELIAVTLSKVPFSHSYTDDWETIGYYNPEIVLQHPLTIREHIWTLFTVPTNICYTEIGMQDDQNWIDIFRRLVSDGHIDKIKLLKNVLSTLTHTSFNKSQIVWFGDLFRQLEPTEDELLAIQPELFAALSSPQSKPIVMLLGYLAQISSHDDFMLDQFYVTLPVVLTSTVKAVLKATFSLAEKLLKMKKGDSTVICSLLCQGLLTKDEGIQKQISKIITKYSTPAQISADVSVYADSILAAVQPLLSDYLCEKKSSFKTNEETKDTFINITNQLADEQQIQTIDHWDDFVFFAGQLFDCNEVCHFSMLPDCLIRFDKEMTSDRALQLLPFFKKALKMEDHWNGLYKCNLQGNFVISYGKILAGRYPQLNKEFKDIITSEAGIEDFSDVYCWQQRHFVNNVYLQGLFLAGIIQGIKEGKAQQLLSTPTHSPLWIDPVVLVERLTKAQKSGEPLWSIDLEMALQWCFLCETTEALKMARTELNGELKELIIFFFDKQSTINYATVTHKNWWITAYLTKYPNEVPTDEVKSFFNLNDIPHQYFTGQLEWGIEEPKRSYEKKRFTLTLPEYTFTGNENVKFIAEYDYFTTKNTNHFHTYRDTDAAYFICNNPYNHGIAVMKALNFIWNYNSKLSSDVKQRLSDCMRLANELGLPYTDVDHLILCVNFLSPDKEMKDLASAYWIAGTQHGVVDNKKTGTELAKLINTQWIPASRFTDMATNSMLHINTVLNQALETMLRECILQLEITETKDLKKILELYHEVLLCCSLRPVDLVAAKIKEWANLSGPLKKLAKQMIQ